MPPNPQTLEFSVHILDIWSFDDENVEPIDLWEKEGQTENTQVGKVEEKEAEADPIEVKLEQAEGSGAKAKEDEVIASVWELLMHSRDHREALVLALDQRKISMRYTPEQMVGSLTETPSGTIMFSNDDLPLEGRDHRRALFIKAEVKGKMTCCVMVDNGSAINVCPLKILPKLGLAMGDMKPSEVIIKAYDDMRRPMEGTFRALVRTGPIEAWVDLHVIDILVTFAILLGRPWFYPLGGVPSTLHQKIKFPYEDRVVTISVETEAAIAALRLAPAEIPISPSFEVCMIYEAEMNEKVVMNMMRNMEFFLGIGLWKNQQGPPEFVK